MASFLITFRESLEAALIIAIIVAYLGKIGRRDLNRYVWIGAPSAMGFSLVTGATVLVMYRGLAGASEKLFEGGASILATCVLTYMIFWMAKNARKIRGELQERVDVAIESRYLIGIATLSFVAVVREGIETVLFLTATVAVDGV